MKPLLDYERVDEKEEKAVDWLGRSVVGGTLGGWKTSSFILGTQCLSVVASSGVTSNLVMYLTKVLRQDTATAASNVTNLIGTMFFTSLIGAFLGDACWGRLWTCVFFLVILLLGLLFVSFFESILNLPRCDAATLLCSQRNFGFLWCFYFGLFLLALGNGSYQVTLQSLGADQFDEHAQKASFFNLYLIASNTGWILSMSILTYIETIGLWALGFWISTAAGTMALLLFLLGSPKFQQFKPTGNPFTRVAQVLTAAFLKWDAKVPLDPDLLYEIPAEEFEIHKISKLSHSKSLRWLDKAATITENDLFEGISTNSWNLCGVTQVEEAKCLCRVLPIWATQLYFASVVSQMSTLFVEQGDTMNTQVGILQFPPAAMPAFTILASAIFMPLYNLIVIPLAQRLTRNPDGLTSLQRVGGGLMLTMAAMSSAALVEAARLKIAKQNSLVDDLTPFRPLSILWTVPTYVLLGCAQVFAMVGKMDFFYNEMPEGMRSLGSSLGLCDLAFGSYISGILISLVTKITSSESSPGWIARDLNQGHLDYFYWLSVGLMGVNFISFMVFANLYEYRKQERG